jgi:hypothetical protein
LTEHAVQAVRDALAMLTSVHASPQDLPGLAEELTADRVRQGLVADALVSRFITESARELAGARGMTAPTVLEGITAGLETGDAEHRTALTRALASVSAQRDPARRSPHHQRLMPCWDYLSLGTVRPPEARHSRCRIFMPVVRTAERLLNLLQLTLLVFWEHDASQEKTLHRACVR